MKNMSIKTLSYIILAFIAIYGAFVIYSARTISHNINDAKMFWLKYQDISSPRASAYSSIARAMGYGGMIHNFKNYVLRKDAKHIARVRVAAGEALSSLNRYSETALTPEERGAVRDIRSVIKAYARNMEVAREMAAKGSSARDIDHKVKIDDGPAIRGLAVLKAAIGSNRQQRESGVNRVELLGRFNETLGYGGMIHNFKNYVLRGKASYNQRAKDAINRLYQAMADYRALKVKPAEEMALKRLREVVEQYRLNLGKVGEMVAQSKTPEEIDAVVRIDDKPALSALRILRMEASNRIEISKRRTTDHLMNTTKFSRDIFLGSMIGLALLMALIAYVLLSHVLGPIHKMSKTLAQFIDGDFDVEFYGTDRRDELGYLARVIDKLRVILINYALRRQTKNN